MSKVLLESVRDPGVKKLASRRDAAILIKLGRYRRATVEPAEPQAAQTLNANHAAFDALAGKQGGIAGATVAELQEVASGYGLQESEIAGSGANGNVIKADWIRELEQLRLGDGNYVRTDMHAGTDYNTRQLQAE